MAITGMWATRPAIRTGGSRPEIRGGTGAGASGVSDRLTNASDYSSGSLSGTFTLRLRRPYAGTEVGHATAGGKPRQGTEGRAPAGVGRFESGPVPFNALALVS
jgi:hypothetical protein